jgi:uncharacterized protein YndB with AHSA1/START domain
MTDFGIIIDSHTVRFERELLTSVGRVWDHLTRPEFLAAWLAKTTMDLRVGGEVELQFDVDEVPERKNSGDVVHGVINRFEPPFVLAYSWIVASEIPNAESAVSFEIQKHGEKVLLVLMHQNLPSNLVPVFGAGWHTHLDILLARLLLQEPKPFLPVWQELLPKYEELFATWQTGNPSS